MDREEKGMQIEKKGMMPSHAQDILGRAGRAMGASRWIESMVVILSLRYRGWNFNTNGLHPAIHN